MKVKYLKYLFIFVLAIILYPNNVYAKQSTYMCIGTSGYYAETSNDTVVSKDIIKNVKENDFGKYCTQKSNSGFVCYADGIKDNRHSFILIYQSSDCREEGDKVYFCPEASGISPTEVRNYYSDYTSNTATVAEFNGVSTNDYKIKLKDSYNGKLRFVYNGQNLTKSGGYYIINNVPQNTTITIDIYLKGTSKCDGAYLTSVNYNAGTFRGKIPNPALVQRAFYGCDVVDKWYPSLDIDISTDKPCDIINGKYYINGKETDWKTYDAVCNPKTDTPKPGSGTGTGTGTGNGSGSGNNNPKPTTKTCKRYTTIPAKPLGATEQGKSNLDGSFMVIWRNVNASDQYGEQACKDEFKRWKELSKKQGFNGTSYVPYCENLTENTNTCKNYDGSGFSFKAAGCKQKVCCEYSDGSYDTGCPINERPKSSYNFNKDDNKKIADNLLDNTNNTSTDVKQVANVSESALSIKSKAEIDQLKKYFVSDCYAEFIDYARLNDLKKSIEDDFNRLKTVLPEYVPATDSENVKSICTNDAKQTSNTFVVYNGTYWKATCQEEMHQNGDSAKLVAAGNAFSYDARYNVKRSCKITQNTPPKVKYLNVYSTSCSNCYDHFEKTCVYYQYECGQSHPCQGKRCEDDHSTGPSEEFDSCIKTCDGGEYSQECINKCYNKTYEDRKINDDFALNINNKNKAISFIASYIGEGTHSVDENGEYCPKTRNGRNYNAKCDSVSGCDNGPCNRSGSCYVTRNGDSDTPIEDLKKELTKSRSELQGAIAKVNEALNPGTYKFEITDSYLTDNAGNYYVYKVDSNNEPLVQVLQTGDNLIKLNQVTKKLNGSDYSECVARVDNRNHANIEIPCSAIDWNETATYYETTVREADYLVRLPVAMVDRITNAPIYTSSGFIADENMNGFRINSKEDGRFDKLTINSKNTYVSQSGFALNRYFTDIDSTDFNVERTSDGKVKLLDSCAATSNIKVTANKVGYMAGVNAGGFKGFDSNIFCYYGVYNKLEDKAKMYINNREINKYNVNKISDIYSNVCPQDINDPCIKRGDQSNGGVYNPSNETECETVYTCTHTEIDQLTNKEYTYTYNITTNYCANQCNNSACITAPKCESGINCVGINWIWRPIQLDEMFPNRSPRFNWTSAASQPASISLYGVDVNPDGIKRSIESNAKSTYNSSNLEYHYTLSREQIQNIRDYNNKYVPDINKNGKRDYQDYDIEYLKRSNGTPVEISNFLNDVDHNGKMFTVVNDAKGSTKASRIKLAKCNGLDDCKDY